MEENTISELCRLLSERLVPWATPDADLHLILAQQPWRVPPDIVVSHRPAPPLPASRASRSRIFLARHEREAMHAIRFPYLCCVMEGEVDMRLLFPTPQGQPRHQTNAYQILALPARTFLLIPPGVLYPDGSRIHWERPAQPPADSRVFWIRFLPTGAFCHTCAMQQTRHSCQTDVFVPDMQLAALSELLIEELQSSAEDAGLAAQSLLLLLLLRVRRGLAASALEMYPRRFMSAPQSTLPEERAGSSAGDPSHAPAPANSAIIARACAYVRAHFNEPLTIKDIADYAYVSPSHLTRLFRIQMQTTVMKYVLDHRLQNACFMLANTEQSVQEIAHQVGYERAPQFNRVFKQNLGVTPTKFRIRQRET